MHPYTAALQTLLEQNANPTQAGPMKKYMRDQFEYLGIKSPQLRELLKQFIAANGLPPLKDLDAIRESNVRGRRLVGAVSCCPLAMDFTLHSPYTFEGLQSWQPALGLKGAAYRTKLAEPGFREGVRRELAKPAHFRLFNGEWDKVHVVESRRRTIVWSAGYSLRVVRSARCFSSQ